jgi:hypothetical protein
MAGRVGEILAMTRAGAGPALQVMAELELPEFRQLVNPGTQDGPVIVRVAA